MGEILTEVKYSSSPEEKERALKVYDAWLSG